MTLKSGPRNLITDVPGLLVGNSEEHILKSGVSHSNSAFPGAICMKKLRRRVSP